MNFVGGSGDVIGNLLNLGTIQISALCGKGDISYSDSCDLSYRSNTVVIDCEKFECFQDQSGELVFISKNQSTNMTVILKNPPPEVANREWSFKELY